MRTNSKLRLAALASALLLAAAVSSASANRLSVNERNFRFTYSPISFIPSFGSTVRCPVTLAGSFHSNTGSKVAGALSGFINVATTGTCEAGRARFNTETLPWHIQAASFAGALPNITSITQRLIRPSWEVQGEIFGLRVPCRYTYPSAAATNNRESRGVITSHSPGTESVSSETLGCPSGRLQGSASVKTAGGGNLIVTLVA